MRFIVLATTVARRFPASSHGFIPAGALGIAGAGLVEFAMKRDNMRLLKGA